MNRNDKGSDEKSKSVEGKGGSKERRQRKGGRRDERGERSGSERDWERQRKKERMNE